MKKITIQLICFVLPLMMVAISAKGQENPVKKVLDKDTILSVISGSDNVRDVLFLKNSMIGALQAPTHLKSINTNSLIGINLKRIGSSAIDLPGLIPANPLATFKESLQLPSFHSPLHQPIIKVANTSLVLEYNSYPGNVSNSGFSSDIAVMGVPVDAAYNSGMQDFGLKDRVNFSSFKFNKKQYLKSMQEQLKKIANTDDFFRGYLTKLYEGREGAVKKIRSEVAGVLQCTPDKYLKGIVDRLNVDNLSREDPGQLLRHIMDSQSTLLSEKRKALQMAYTGNGKISADSIQVLEEEIKNLGIAQESLVKNTDSLQQSWNRKGIIQKIRGFDKERTKAIDSLWKRPEIVGELAEKHLQLNGIKKLLLNMRSLKTGASGREYGDLIQGQNIIKGVDLEYAKKGKSFAPVIGSIQGIQNINDLSYTNFNELANTFTSGMRIGKEAANKDFSQVSFFMFQQQGNGLPGGDFLQGLSKNFIFSINRKISFGQYHTVLAEVSKSTTIYGSALQGDKEGLASGLLGNNIFDNMGLDLTYEGEFEKIGLQEELVVRFKGNEYSSLGNTFSVNGEKEISNALKKSFYGNRLQVSLKGRMREFSLGATESKWRNMSYMADVKMKFKKGEFIEFRLQPSKSLRIEPTLRYTASKSDRFSLRGNINRKIGKGYTYRNYIDISSVKDIFADRSGSKNSIASSFIITSLQSVQIGRKNLFVNTIWNNALNRSDYLIFNSSLSVDAGMLYTLKDLISLSSSLAYNHTDLLYTQVALRQSVSTEIGKKMSVSAYINAGKNIRSYSAIYIPEISGTVSIRYTLNK